ncbi:MAG: hypothetical protein KDA41_04515, partial [Planctomycetales bacterium]|nr:hypothetical protein [Planctomycetales bacterium]
GSQLNFVMRRLLALGGLPRWLRPALAAVLRMMGDGKLGELVAAAGPRSADGYRRLIAQARELSLSYLESLRARRIDAVVAPPHALPAVRHGHGGPDLMPAAGYAFAMNLLGVPAGVVAAGRVREDEAAVTAGGDKFAGLCRSTIRDSAGLPVGVQVAALPWREDIALCVMEHLEAHFQTQPDYPGVCL